MTTPTAISLLRQIVLSTDCAKMNRSTVKGFLGELLVKERLEREGISVEHLGNQNGFDLRFFVNGRTICADVKMSMPKDEFKWGFEYWGWALLHENKKKEVSATHFICVGCSESLEVESLYVAPSLRLSEFPKGIRQFSKVKHGLILQRDALPAGVAQPEAELYSRSRQLLNDGTVINVAAAQRLSDACV